METQMKTQGKKRLSPAKGHVCIWNASMPAKSSKSRVLITAASPSPSAMTRVWRLGASIASVPKPKKFLPASQYLFFQASTFTVLSLTQAFSFAVAITLPNVTSWLKTLISVQIPALIRNGTWKPATSVSPEAKTTTRVRIPFFKEFFGRQCSKEKGLLLHFWKSG